MRSGTSPEPFLAFSSSLQDVAQERGSGKALSGGWIAGAGLSWAGLGSAVRPPMFCGVTQNSEPPLLLCSLPGLGTA